VARWQLPAHAYGGLLLDRAPDRVGLDGAIDISNVALDRPGIVPSRHGYEDMATVSTSYPVSILPFQNGSDRYVIIGQSNNDLRVYDAAGSEEDSSNAPTSSEHSFVAYGSPAGPAVYAANGDDQVRKYTVAAGFSTPAGLSGQTGKYLAVDANSNRLVVARESGTTAGNNDSSVNFSDAGDPETFTATNFVDLDPGDGEPITGVASYQDFVMVFKSQKFYVFYGEGTDQVGEPIFEYRKVTGIGCDVDGAVAADHTGVYFLNLKHGGIFKTTGGPARPITDNVAQLFRRSGIPFFADGDEAVVGHGNTTYRLGLSRGIIFLGFGLGPSDSRPTRWLVGYLDRNAWTYWTPATGLWTSPFVPWVDSDEMPGHLVGWRLDASTHRLVFMSEASEDDRGTAIPWRYRSGLYGGGWAGREGRVVETRLWGTGSVTWKTSRNWEALGSGGSVTLGVSPAVDSAVARNTTRAGHLMSHELSGTGHAAVHALTHEMEGPRAPGSNTP
jgi:hypothetical protein